MPDCVIHLFPSFPNERSKWTPQPLTSDYPGFACWTFSQLYHSPKKTTPLLFCKESRGVVCLPSFFLVFGNISYQITLIPRFGAQSEAILLSARLPISRLELTKCPYMEHSCPFCYNGGKKHRPSTSGKQLFIKGRNPTRGSGKERCS